MYQFSRSEFLNLFDDPEKAEMLLKNIIAHAPDSHTVFLSRLHYELLQNPLPDEVFNNFEKLTGSVINKLSFYKMLCDYPPIVARLVRIFTSSRFLSDLIIKDFQYIYFLIRPDVDCPLLDTDAIRKSICTIIENPSYSINRKLDQLRILKRRELLKIGVRDFILNDPLEVTMQAISALADSILQAVLDLTYHSLTIKHSNPTTAFAIIALGKLGGYELNYSSDIDLLFVYGEEGTIHSEDREISNHEFYNQLCSSFVSATANISQEGQLYRVDNRLRPDGEAGPLARCVRGFIHYYESRGQIWERQMLIKARVVAGDMTFGRRFIDQLTPFIYPKTFFNSPLKEIAKMKWRIEEQKSTDKLNIKICPGGIRDIEFIVQALQLINGGRLSEVRSGNTLLGLTKLFNAGLLTNEEHALLSESYLLYRRIEHLLQIADDRQIHSLSGDKKQVLKIGFLLNFKNDDDFLQKLDRQLKTVRKVYNAVFEVSAVEKLTVHDDLIRFLSSETMADMLQPQLTHFGFETTHQAFRILRLLYFGKFPKPHSGATQDLFAQLLPHLLNEIKQTFNPDHALLNFERIVSAYPYTDVLYREFHDQHEFLSEVIHLCSYSHSFVDVLCDRPFNIDYLISHHKDWMQSLEYSPEREYGNYASVHDFKKMEFLKLSLQYQFCKKTLGQLFFDLSVLADLILIKAFTDHFSVSDDIVLIGLGKLGGRELSFKSDLDVVFVCDDRSDVDDLIAKAKRFLNTISEITPRGRLYEIDARLRPEGKQAPLVVTVSRYEDYLESRAMFWEKQSLVKARFISGNVSAKQKTLELFKKIVYEYTYSQNEIRSILTMRLRQSKEKIRNISDSIHDFKFSRGALLDIEYLVQAYQMKYGGTYSSLQKENTLEAITALQKLSLITDGEYQALIQNYTFFRELEVFNYLIFERKSNKLPSDEKQLAFLSKFCKFNKDRHLLENLSNIKKQNELLFSKLMRELEYGK